MVIYILHVLTAKCFYKCGANEIRLKSQNSTHRRRMHGIQLRFPSLTGNQPLFPGKPVGALTVGTTDTPDLFRSFSLFFLVLPIF